MATKQQPAGVSRHHFFAEPLTNVLLATYLALFRSGDARERVRLSSFAAGGKRDTPKSKSFIVHTHGAPLSKLKYRGSPKAHSNRGYRLGGHAAGRLRGDILKKTLAE